MDRGRNCRRRLLFQVLAASALSRCRALGACRARGRQRCHRNFLIRAVSLDTRRTRRKVTPVKIALTSARPSYSGTSPVRRAIVTASVLVRTPSFDRTAARWYFTV